MGRDVVVECQQVMGGPWHDDSGALLLCRVDRAEVDAIMTADPYRNTPRVSVAALRRWHPVVGDNDGSSSRSYEQSAD